MKLIKNKVIMFSKNKGQYDDILYESIHEIKACFSTISNHQLGRLNKIQALYKDKPNQLLGFVEMLESTDDNPIFIHVIGDDVFKVKRELDINQFNEFKR